MPTFRETTLPGYRSAGRWSIATRDNDRDASNENSHIRLLILDTGPATLEQIENALWIWPHTISTANTVDEAIRMCQHLEPTAILVSRDFPSNQQGSAITALRRELPNIAIVALGSAADVAKPGAILDLGADAILFRDELHRPTLHDLLMHLRPVPAMNDAPVAVPPVTMQVPWSESQIVGSLLCDIEGSITSANECLARWLQYSTPSALLGKCVWRDVLSSRTDWTAWKTVSSGTAAILHQSISVKARNKQLLWMNVQVFSAPDSPTALQALFVDQTELAHLTGRFQSC